MLILIFLESRRQEQVLEKLDNPWYLLKIFNIDFPIVHCWNIQGDISPLTIKVQNELILNTAYGNYLLKGSST